MYYLSGLGGAIGGEGSTAAAIGGMTQQHLAAQSKHKLSLEYINMIRKMIEGGGKFSMDKDKIKLDAPVSALGDQGVPALLGGETPPKPSVAPPTPGDTSALTAPSIPAPPSRLDLLNPSASPLDVRIADLVGLTPQDVSQALQTGLDYGEVMGRSISDISGATADLLAEFRRIKEIPEKVDVKVGDQVLSVDPKNALTFYAKKYKLPAAYETYLIAREDPEFMRHLKSISGIRFDVGEFREKEEAAAEMKRRAFFKTPKFRIDAEKIVDDRWRIKYESASDPTQARNILVFKEMDKQIKASFPDAIFGRDPTTGIRGWYDNKEELIAPWQ
jgi:hypothetical protein